MPAEVSETIERGPNQISITLERDPFGLLPGEACAEGETLVYIEDFQDGTAQGWKNITAALEFGANNGWAITTDEEGNKILTASNASGFVIDELLESNFEDAVWRIKLKVAGRDADMFLNWHQGSDAEGDWRYIVQLGANVMVDLSRLQNPEPGHFSVGMSSLQIPQDQWHLFEIGTSGDTTDLWVNGRQLQSYTDPQPLPAGFIGLETHLFEGSETVFSFDDLVVCEIDAPFDSILAAESQ
jgi:hypothetical protein